MAPLAVDIEHLKEDITRWILDGITIEDVSQILRRRNLPLSTRSLRRRLQAWRISTKPRLDYASADLAAQVVVLFYQWRLGDKEMIEVLRCDGHELQPEGLRRLRRRLGLRARIPVGQEEAVEQRIREVLRGELDDGTVEDLGRTNLYAYMREKHHIVGR